MSRALSWIVLVLAGAGAAGVSATTATEVAWLQVPRSCPIAPGEILPGDTEEPQVIACGGAGIFVFGKPGLHYGGDCPTLDSGAQVPAPIPAEPAPSLPQTFPCSHGSCLGRVPGRPWVAILDWPNAHGWSVAATVREASDQRLDIQLYDLTAAGPMAQWVPHVSDLHVLVQLCAVAEEARAHPGDRPRAVNMSFGRPGTAGCESGPALGCSAGRVLSHLAATGIVPVAAAGNHQALLFPASSPAAVSAGALDLAHLQLWGESRPSRQTPPTAEALMVGYGIYLSMGGADDPWPAPPGSSYAAALFTGWLGGTLANPDNTGRLPALPAAGALWTPVATPLGLALAVDGTPLSGSELQGPRRLLERATGPAARIPSSKEVVATLTGPAPPLPESAVLYADGGNGPQPGVDPCVPCRGGGMEGVAAESAGTVHVDLSHSGALPPGMELIAVFLRVGEAVHSMDVSREPGLLAALAAGNVEVLGFAKAGGVFQEGEQPSLVLVVNVAGSAYWHEVPVHLPW